MKISEVTNKVVRASDPVPKLSKPTTGREQPHPYTGMLVGSKNNEVEEGAVTNAAATLVIAASLYGLASMAPSAKDTPLGKELTVAAQQGDQVAAYHLKNLDLYIDSGMSRTMVNLRYAYIDDNTDPKYMDFLTDPKRFPQLEVKNESAGDLITEEQFDQLAEKQDACYHKVKSRYKVWPSAYASGALVKCRKVGAKNWGNSSKKKKSKKK